MDDPSEFDPVPGKAIALGANIRRILAPNPSPMTFRGTNTYLIGTSDIAIIDPGPASDAHLAAILEALNPGQHISHIFVTHSHLDHSPLAKPLASATGASVHAFGNSFAGRTPMMERLARQKIGGGEGVDHSFMPDIVLQDGDRVSGTDWHLRPLHTPGHFGNHLCFALEASGHLFTGDLVMGWATSMVSPPDGDLTQFMMSLQKLTDRDEDRIYLPGHGAEIANPKARLSQLITHRKGREQQIISALRLGPNTAAGLTKMIYTDISPDLHPAAERNVLAHLIDLNTRNQISVEAKISPGAMFSLT